MAQVTRRITSGYSLTTLYSTCQCILSVVGSVGVILLFAGIPQLIYSPHLDVGNLLTFLLGVLLITTMVAGNAVLNFRYQQHCRQEADNAQIESANRRRSVKSEDKPPSYETLAELEGLPAYHQIVQEKPPRYEDISVEVVMRKQSGNSSSEKNCKDSSNIPPVNQATAEDVLSNMVSPSMETATQLNNSTDVTISVQEKEKPTSSINVKDIGNYSDSEISDESTS